VKRFWLGVVVVLGTFTYSAADPGTADRLAREAETLAATGDFLAAAARFREAYAADPRAELICNVGVAYHKATDLPRAQLTLTRCLERGTALDPKFVEAARAVLASVEGTLRVEAYTPLEIVVEPPSATVAIASFADDETFVGSRVVWMPYGTHRVTFSADGYREQVIEVVASSHDRTPVRAKLERVVLVVPRVTPRAHTEQRSKIPAIVATGITVFLISGAAYSYNEAHVRAERAPFALSDEIYANDLEDVDSWNRRMVISASLALVGAGASSLLWYRALQPVQVEIAPSGSGVAMWFRGHF
jgi:hypothetical protein